MKVLRSVILACFVFLSLLAGQSTAPSKPPVASASSGVYQVGYMSNLVVHEGAYLNISNVGTLLDPDSDGQLCANVYVFDSEAEPLACCSCPVKPNTVVTMSAGTDLLPRQTFFSDPQSIVVKILFTAKPHSAACDASSIPISGITLARGGVAWSTTSHPNTSISPVSYEITELPLVKAELAWAELIKMVAICDFIVTYAQRTNICRGCKPAAQ